MVHLSELARLSACGIVLAPCCAIRDRVTYGVTHQADVLVNRHGHKGLVKDLILVMVDNDVLRVVVLWCEKTIHPTWQLKPVVEHHGRIADLAELVVRVAIELFDHLFVKVLQEWLVERLYGDNNVLHGWYGVLLLDYTQGSVSVAETISIAPTGQG